MEVAQVTTPIEYFGPPRIVRHSLLLTIYITERLASDKRRIQTQTWWDLCVKVISESCVGADPQFALLILGQRPDPFVAQSIFLRKCADCIALD